jgi:hypothetical protein
MTDKTLRAYRVEDRMDNELAVAVIVENKNQAKCIGYRHLKDYGDLEYIDVRATLIKDCDVTGLPYGAFEDGEEGIRRGIYGYMEQGICDDCQSDINVVSAWTDKAGKRQCLCYDCQGKREEKNV